jgi:hypothetical protein
LRGVPVGAVRQRVGDRGVRDRDRAGALHRAAAEVALTRREARAAHGERRPPRDQRPVSPELPHSPAPPKPGCPVRIAWRRTLGARRTRLRPITGRRAARGRRRRRPRPRARRAHRVSRALSRCARGHAPGGEDAAGRRPRWPAVDGAAKTPPAEAACARRQPSSRYWTERHFASNLADWSGRGLAHGIAPRPFRTIHERSYT